MTPAALLSGAWAALLLAAAPSPGAWTAPNPQAQAVHAAGRNLFALQWRQPVVRTGVYRTVRESFGAPVVSRRHRVVIVGTGEGDVLALAVDDGQLVWRLPHGVPFETAAVLHTGADGRELALLGARDGHLLAVDVADGHLAWQLPIDGDVRAPPQRWRDRLVLTTANNKVVQVDPEQQTVVWSQGRSVHAGLSVEGHARATVAGDRIFATFADGYALALGAEHGDIVWSRPLSLRGGPFHDADADPQVVDGKLLVASYSDGVYALDPDDGKTLWNHAAVAVTSLATPVQASPDAPSLVYAGSADGWIWGLHPADGALAFRTKVVEGPVSRMQARRGVVALTAGPNGLVALEGRTGRPLQATPLGGRSANEPVWDGETMALLTGSGSVYFWTTLEP